MQGDKVMICVLVMDKPLLTSACLRSLMTTSYESYKLLVIDNGSSAYTVRLLEKFRDEAVGAGFEFRLILNSCNRGIASGRNQALELLDVPYIVFVDNDVEVVDPVWLENLVMLMEGDEQIGIAVPQLLFPLVPHEIQHAGGGVSVTGRVCDMGRNCVKNDYRFREARDVQFASGACMLVRRSVADRAGFFDRIYDPVMFEDVDYSYRVRSLGYRVRYLPFNGLYHWENSTTFYAGRLNSRYYFVRHSLIFKQRWRHMYEVESGPADSEVSFYNARGISVA